MAVVVSRGGNNEELKQTNTIPLILNLEQAFVFSYNIAKYLIYQNRVGLCQSLQFSFCIALWVFGCYRIHLDNTNPCISTFISNCDYVCYFFPHFAAKCPNSSHYHFSNSKRWITLNARESITQSSFQFDQKMDFEVWKTEEFHWLLNIPWLSIWGSYCLLWYDTVSRFFLLVGSLFSLSL